MKKSHYIPIAFLLIISTTLLYITHTSCPKSKCYFCSGRYQSFISYDSAFGIINLNSRNASTIPKGNWSGQNGVTINTAQNGSMIMISPGISNCYRADISLLEGSQPDESIMAEYLCRDCVKKYSESEYDVILMDAASGSIYLISKSMQLELPPYQVTSSPQKDPQMIRLCFEKIE